jgi:hypothetical protein
VGLTEQDPGKIKGIFAAHCSATIFAGPSTIDSPPDSFNNS